MKQAWKSKFKAQPITLNGIRFASKKEGARYLELLMLEKAGHIKNLELQPRFDIVINGKKCGFYKADFAFFADNKRKIVDVKGVRLPVYILKKKIVEALYSVEIIEE